ncbi:MAG: hypothetical protein PHG91_12715 [Syntrophales bacterium]|nr:hypothetical protein [Syntrophales bacterium]MDD5234248.1 hypothetical protein [Syntrophales bacterium]MDD5533188.1 hypothetical protein [Syntrophales bacterium]
MLLKEFLKCAAAGLVLACLFPSAAVPAMKTAVIAVPGCVT